MNKIYTIILTEEEIDNFNYECQIVELTIEKIMSQVKAQGYINPNERDKETL